MLDLQKQTPVVTNRDEQKTLEQQELTTQEAADLLNVPESYLVKLLEDGDLPFKKVDTQPYIGLEDLMRYKKVRDDKRHKLLDEMMLLNEELGFYDE